MSTSVRADDMNHTQSTIQSKRARQKQQRKEEIKSMYEEESDESKGSRGGDDPDKPGHLILLDGPGLSKERKITPFIY
jgi:hypothetical protein